ncbi:hypothetical protein F5J12DRAFT_784465 [Pisolithus orientalis]|uniref:uncharacterized protein n=1 Tax=Pisolithus orientalis TaxID=936130 RepID=UPI0022245B56|nr:uncharacterized protein F5J12DRAFT_784465 [Pisolithus orientalis]KAI6000152.1 hypothetical protein F5J12DRAFT_784465 [Pisolithus orientalis]
MSHHLTPPPSSPQTHQYEYHKGSPSHVPPSPPQSLSTEEVQMPLQLHNKSYSGDNLSVSIPPAAHNLSAHVKHSHTKFMPYSKPSAIELCFAKKSLGRQSVNDITLEDAQVGRALFVHGLMGLSKRAFQKALEMKEANQELRQLHALSTAWEIKAIDHWRDFLLAMQEEEETQFLQSTKDLQLFKDIMEHHSVSQLEEEEEYHIGAYGQDLMLLTLERGSHR